MFKHTLDNLFVGRASPAPPRARRVHKLNNMFAYVCARFDAWYDVDARWTRTRAHVEIEIPTQSHTVQRILVSQCGSAAMLRYTHLATIVSIARRQGCQLWIIPQIGNIHLFAEYWWNCWWFRYLLLNYWASIMSNLFVLTKAWMFPPHDCDQ